MHLLRLPAEIRVLVYTSLFEGKRVRRKHVRRKNLSKTVEWPTVDTTAGGRIANAIAFTCQQVYNEAMPVLYRLATFSLERGELEELERRTLARQLTRMHRINIELSDLVDLGFDLDTRTWLRTDKIMSLKSIHISEYHIFCGCDYDYMLWQRLNLLHSMKNPELITQLILAARAVNIDLSWEFSLSEICYETTTTFEISSTFGFNIILWKKGSQPSNLDIYTDGLQKQGLTQEIIVQEIKRHDRDYNPGSSEDEDDE